MIFMIMFFINNNLIIVFLYFFIFLIPGTVGIIIIIVNVIVVLIDYDVITNIYFLMLKFNFFVHFLEIFIFRNDFKIIDSFEDGINS